MPANFYLGTFDIRIKIQKQCDFRKLFGSERLKPKSFEKFKLVCRVNHKFPNNVIVKQPMFFHFIKNVGHDFWSVIRIFGSLDVSVTLSIIHRVCYVGSVSLLLDICQLYVEYRAYLFRYFSEPNKYGAFFKALGIIGIQIFN